MSALPHTAREARRIAQTRHRNQVLLWQSLFGVATLCAIIATVTAYYVAASGWRQERAMPMQRVQVLTDGFVDKNGNWRSFDNGERIEVEQWRP